MSRSRRTRTRSVHLGEQLERCFGGGTGGLCPKPAGAGDTREAKGSGELPGPAAATVPEGKQRSGGAQGAPRAHGAGLRAQKKGPTLGIHTKM